MKIFGSTSNSKHSQGHVSQSAGGKHLKKKTNIFLRVVIIILAVAACLAIAAYAYWTLRVKPPEVTRPSNPANNTQTEHTTPSTNTDTNTQTDNQDPRNTNVDPNTQTDPSGTDEPPAENTEPDVVEEVYKYTFAVLGCDNGFGNTDVIMTGTFDTKNYTLTIVSIPRDTLVNVEWDLKKANTWYYYGADKENRINNVKAGLKDVCGYDIDFVMIIDMNAFKKLIDGIGGVDYYLSRNLNYDDDYQNLHIHLSAGQQHFDGDKALKLLRFRSGYSDADIGRIKVQHDFLKTMVKQILANTSKVPVTTIADIIINDVETDLNEGNIIWFAKEFFKLNADNIQFMTIPANTNDFVYVNGVANSYVTITVDEWLEVINEYLNPLDYEITEKDLDILTKVNGKLYVTSGVKRGSASWGTGGKKTTTTTTNTNTNTTTNTNTNTNTNTAANTETNTGTDETNENTGGVTNENTAPVETTEPATGGEENTGPVENTESAEPEPEPQPEPQPEPEPTPAPTEETNDNPPTEAGGEGANE